ncbi:hypothetical protein [Chromobacterium amazonense]|uniref:Uncharacterized protein n=1 Tax=Chromobacterium amazonense TaxID=1382803 RepID=A0ABU8V216_9NEIS|nr:hypothetical protein [Chromobacterium amazonense]MBM2885784.1 hypothetical protein [Chromobacterium amazonense]MDE1713860.1 hypothetical protein [Chromobacterium amazonense]MDQ4541685.1 hypothetical protein [Chromobacterium amazonense]
MASFFILSRHLLRDVLGRERADSYSLDLSSLYPPSGYSDLPDDYSRREALWQRHWQLRLAKGGVC